MSRQMIDVTDADFRKVVLESPHPVLVDFTATWCPPCRAIKPALEELAGQYQGRVTVATIDVDANHGVTQEYSVRAMPTLLMFKGGKVVNQLVGAVPKTKLDAFIQQAL